MACFLPLISLLLLPGLLQAQQLVDLQVKNQENLEVQHQSGRLLEAQIGLGFSSFTSSLLPLFPVSSSEYRVFTLAVGGVVSGLLLAYAIFTDAQTRLYHSRSVASRSFEDKEQVLRREMKILQGLPL